MKRFIIYLGLFLLSFQSISQSNNSSDDIFYLFHRLNETHGLSNNDIVDIVQDALGFMWIATNDGLFRYDGNEFVTFRNISGDSTSLPHNSVQKLFIDNDAKLWVLTDFGIGIFNYNNKTFKQILPGSNSGDLNHRSTTTMCGLGQKEKLIGTFGGGISIVDEDNKFGALIPKINHDNINFAEQLIIQLHLDSDSVLWIGTWNDGLILYDLKYGDVTPVKLTEENPLRIYSMFESNSKSIWLGTNQGIFIFDRGSKKPKHISSINHKWMHDDDILDIFEDRNGLIWVGTRNEGLFSINQRLSIDNDFQMIKSYSPSIYSTNISSRTISKIIQDNEGNIWLGTHNTGINVFNPDGEVVKNFNYISEFPEISQLSVWGMCEGTKNNIWMGTDGHGVFVIDPYKQSTKKIPTDKFSDQAILCALKDQDNNIWFGTYSGGINIYNPINGNVKVLNKKNGLIGNDVRALMESKNGNIWIATNGNGLFNYNQKNSLLIQIEITNYLDIRDIKEDENGMLWLATFGDGLCQYNPINNSVIFFDWSYSLSYTPVAFDLCLMDDNIWIGTRQQGLLKFNKNSKKFTVFSENNGLENNTVRGIIKDKLGFLWLSTNVGISCFDTEKETFRNFDYSDGLQLGQYNDGSALLLSNGDLAFGGIHGLNIFSTKELLSSQMPPDVLFLDLNIRSKKLKDDTKFSTGNLIDSTNQIILAYHQNTITIEFSAIDYPNASSWEYEYMLLGNENEWNTNKELRTVTYHNLAPGQYEFLVRSTDKSGINKGKSAELKFEILDPWWNTWYAYVIYSVVILTVIFLIVWVSNNQIKLKQKLIYREKLQDKEKEAMQRQIRFFTNFSHELRTPLTLIKGPIDDLLSKTELIKHKGLLHLIKKNSLILINLVNRLLEFRKIETENTVLNIGLYDLSILIEEEAEAFAYQASLKGINLVREPSSEILTYVDIEKILIVLNNLLSNAVKYTPENGDISISLKRLGDEIIIEIKDSGPGIPIKEQKSIFTPFYQADNSIGKGGTGIGLALTKSLVEMHHGIIELESNEKGSCFTVKLPNDLKSAVDNKNIRLIEEFTEVETIDLELDSIDKQDESKKQILVVDDNEDILKYVNNQLKNDFNILRAKDGEEGFQLASKSIPDLIISDIMMPKVDGLEFCKRLKESNDTNHIPILLLTAKSDDNAKVDAYNIGVDGYITKPFTSQLLIARVDNLLSQREKLKEIYAAGEWEKELDIQDAPSVQFLKKIESTILNMIEESDISVPKLALELCLSRTSLYRKIKSLTGLSINKFIRLVKLKHAAQLLRYNDSTVSEVAFQIGFNDLKYFRDCFKEKYGVLPSEYQKLNKIDDIDTEEIKSALDI